MSYRVSAIVPDVSATIRRDVRAVEKEHRRAAIDVTDEASKKAQRHVQAKMRSVGLGKLSNAVGHTSTKRKRQTNPNDNPYGVIFARGGDESRAGQALESYTRGATIVPRKGKWLAFPTSAVPRLVSVGGARRQRLTPELWKKSGLEARVGKLVFIQTSASEAVLVVNKVSLSSKTGQAKALGKRRPRTRVVPDKPVVVFVLIKNTRRAQRFDQREIMRYYAERMPDYIRRTLRGYNRGAQ